MEDIFRGIGIEISLKEPDDFLKIKETLTRIGAPSREKKILYQSCHILHKQGRYVICHFKELYQLDRRSADLSENDIARRNTIANILSEWGLLKLIDVEKSKNPVVPVQTIKILQHKEKGEWILQPKYNIGGRNFTKN